MRILYFDIDGVFLSYNEIQRPLLTNGELQDRLKELNFDKFVCLSGWSDIFNTGMIKKSEDEQKKLLHLLLNEIFTDKKWFLERLEIAYDTDHRCKHINFKSDWFYIDDWADKFFSEQFGEKLYKKMLGHRILLVNPHDDGSDILDWLDNAVKKSANNKF